MQAEIHLSSAESGELVALDRWLRTADLSRAFYSRFLDKAAAAATATMFEATAIGDLGPVEFKHKNLKGKSV